MSVRSLLRAVVVVCVLCVAMGAIFSYAQSPPVVGVDAKTKTDAKADVAKTAAPAGVESNSSAEGGAPAASESAIPGKDSETSPVEEDITGKIMNDPVGAVKGFFTSIVEDNFNVKEFSLWRILYLAVGIAVTLALARLVRWFVGRYAAKLAGRTKSLVDDLVCEAIAPPSGLLVFSIGLYISSYPMMRLLSDKLQVGYGRLCLALASSQWFICRFSR